jgi:hypothetical protein
VSDHDTAHPVAIERATPGRGDPAFEVLALIARLSQKLMGADTADQVHPAHEEEDGRSVLREVGDRQAPHEMGEATLATTVVPCAPIKLLGTKGMLSSQATPAPRRQATSVATRRVSMARSPTVQANVRLREPAT